MRKTLAGAVVGGRKEGRGGDGVHVVARPWRRSLVKVGGRDRKTCCGGCGWVSKWCALSV